MKPLPWGLTFNFYIIITVTFFSLSLSSRGLFFDRIYGNILKVSYCSLLVFITVYYYYCIVIIISWTHLAMSSHVIMASQLFQCEQQLQHIHKHTKQVFTHSFTHSFTCTYVHVTSICPHTYSHYYIMLSYYSSAIRNYYPNKYVQVFCLLKYISFLVCY